MTNSGLPLIKYEVNGLEDTVSNEQLRPAPYCHGGAHRVRLGMVAPGARSSAVLGRG